MNDADVAYASANLELARKLDQIRGSKVMGVADLACLRGVAEVAKLARGYAMNTIGKACADSNDPAAIAEYLRLFIR